MQRSIIVFMLCCFIIVPINAQEDDDAFPDIIGKTIAQAEALLNASDFRLAPTILITDEADGDVNTIVDYSILDDDNLVQVTVLRAYNVSLVWDNTEFFANFANMRNLANDDLLTLINLSDEDIPLRNIQIADFDSSRWQAVLRANQCAQIWTFTENNPFQLDDCATIQGANVTSISDAASQFWRSDEPFEVYQNGIQRASCDPSAGRCDFWVSHSIIADDLAPYLYAIYDDSQFIMVNNDDTRWMDLSQLNIASIGDLSDMRTWETITHPDLDRLAPNQCVWVTRNANADMLMDCQVIATLVLPASDIFWTAPFAIEDRITQARTLDCPAAIDQETRCLLSRG